MTENEVKVCENWFSPLFYLFLFCWFFFALARTSPCQQSLFCLLDFGVLEKTLSLKKNDKGSVRHTGTCILHWRERERCVAILLFATTALMETVCFLFLFLFLLLFSVLVLYYVFFLSIVAFLPITLQFLFHNACNVTTYQPSNSLRKSGKQVTALARVQALEKQLKRKWTTSSQRKQPTFRDANIYSSRKDVWETREEIPYWWPGGGIAVYGLYRYVPLWRVWFSSSSL